MKRLFGAVCMAVGFAAMVSACVGDVGPVAPDVGPPRTLIGCGGEQVALAPVTSPSATNGGIGSSGSPLNVSLSGTDCCGGGTENLSAASGGSNPGSMALSSGEGCGTYCASTEYMGVGCNGEECRGTPYSSGWIGNIDCDPHDCRNQIGGAEFNCDGDGGGGGGMPQPPTLSIDCGETTVVRGESISCLAKASSGTVSVSNWTFDTDSAGVLDRYSLPTSNPIAGPMVTSGWLVVTATVGSQSGKKDSVHLEVLARNNFAPGPIPFRLDTMPIPSGLIPTAFADLGWTFFDIQSGSGSAPYAEVQSGPNKGLYYFVALPTFVAEVFINDSHILSGGSIYQRHATSTVAGQCSPQFLSTILPGLIRAHEGLGLEPMSHSERYKTAVENDLESFRAIAEAWTPNGSISQSSAYRLKFEEPYAAASLVAQDVDSGGTVPAIPMSCQVRF